MKLPELRLPDCLRRKPVELVKVVQIDGGNPHVHTLEPEITDQDLEDAMQLAMRGHCVRINGEVPRSEID